MSGPSEAAKMAEAVASMTEMLRTVLESTTGYRAQAEAAGFSPTAAERLSIDFHHCLLDAIAHAITSRKPPQARE